MTKHLLLTIALVGVSGWTRAEDAPPMEKDAKPIEALVGMDFSITLEANRTTGYGWQLAKPLRETVVKSVTNSYQEPAQAPDAPPRVGSGGKEIWTFKATGPGRAVIEFNYVRPWEKDTPPVKTAKFVVVVKNPQPK